MPSVAQDMARACADSSASGYRMSILDGMLLMCGALFTVLVVFSMIDHFDDFDDEDY